MGVTFTVRTCQKLGSFIQLSFVLDLSHFFVSNLTGHNFQLFEKGEGGKTGNFERLLDISAREYSEPLSEMQCEHTQEMIS